MRFPEFSGEWENKTLKSVLKCHDNFRIPLSDKQRKNMKGQYAYYGANGIIDFIDKFIFNGNYILLAEDGGKFDEFRTKPIAHKASGKFWVNNHAHVLSTNNILDFVFYQLEHKDIRSFINIGSRSKLNKNDMFNIIISLCSLKEQSKIANFLSLIDKRIELQNKIIKDYELLKKETKNRIFARLLSCEKRHFLEIFASFIELNNNDYPQYTIGKQGLLPLPIENQKYNKKHHIVFKENTCIFGIGINEVGVSIDTIGCCSPIYKVYSINDKIIDTYFLQQFINKYLMLNINKITKKSTRREFEIDNSELLKISFNIPNLLVQKRISNIFNKISIYLKLNLEILENLQCLKKHLLAKMFI